MKPAPINMSVVPAETCRAILGTISPAMLMRCACERVSLLDAHYLLQAIEQHEAKENKHLTLVVTDCYGIYLNALTHAICSNKTSIEEIQPISNPLIYNSNAWRGASKLVQFLLSKDRATYLKDLTSSTLVKTWWSVLHLPSKIDNTTLLPIFHNEFKNRSGDMEFKSLLIQPLLKNKNILDVFVVANPRNVMCLAAFEAAQIARADIEVLATLKVLST